MPHSDNLRLGIVSGATINRAGQVGLLTDATVAAADTLNGLDSAVNAVTNIHADQLNYRSRVKFGWRVFDAYTDAAVLPLTTVAQLAALGGAVPGQFGLLQND